MIKIDNIEVIQAIPEPNINGDVTAFHFLTTYKDNRKFLPLLKDKKAKITGEIDGQQFRVIDSYTDKVNRMAVHVIFEYI